MISKRTGIAADSARGAKNLWRTRGMDLFYKFLLRATCTKEFKPVSCL